MRILVDMNLSPLWIPFLQQQGFDATTGRPSEQHPLPMPKSSPMPERMDFVILTHDLDVGMLLAIRGSDGPSVVQIRTQDVHPAAVGSLVVNALKDARLHLDAGALVTIDPM